MALENLIIGIGNKLENISDRKVILTKTLVVATPLVIALKYGFDAPSYIVTGEFTKAYWSMATCAVWTFSSGFLLGKYTADNSISKQ